MDWTEIKTALAVAREGTVSGAAEHLGVHRATVIRHVDSLEDALGVVLFHRHARGYTPTETAKELMKAGTLIEDQLKQWIGRAKGKADELKGELVVSTLAPLVGALASSISEYQCENPAVVVRVIATEVLARMEYGEAHVALRAGPRPNDPDMVVIHHSKLELGLYAHDSYVQKHGLPQGPIDFGKHRFATSDQSQPRAGIQRWLVNNVPTEAQVLRTTSPELGRLAVLSGDCIGLLSRDEGEQNEALHAVMDPLDDWSVDVWIVTHADLHRTLKVQRFVQILKRTSLTLF